MPTQSDETQKRLRRILEGNVETGVPKCIAIPHRELLVRSSSCVYDILQFWDDDSLLDGTRVDDCLRTRIERYDVKVQVSFRSENVLGFKSKRRGIAENCILRKTLHTRVDVRQGLFEQSKYRRLKARRWFDEGQLGIATCFLNDCLFITGPTRHFLCAGLNYMPRLRTQSIYKRLQWDEIKNRDIQLRSSKTGLGLKGIEKTRNPKLCVAASDMNRCRVVSFGYRYKCNIMTLEKLLEDRHT